jgi:hypothetical protein
MNQLVTFVKNIKTPILDTTHSATNEMVGKFFLAGKINSYIFGWARKSCFSKFKEGNNVILMQAGTDILENFATIINVKFWSKRMSRRRPTFRAPYLPCLSVFASFFEGYMESIMRLQSHIIITFKGKLFQVKRG